jgi:Arc/MetJ-type ribon-helix-helix transcriptional regulator
MTTLNVVLPEELKAFADAEASRSGYADATEYVMALLRDAQQQRAKAELEAELLKGIQSPASEVTADDFARMRQDFEARHLRRHSAGDRR